MPYVTAASRFVSISTLPTFAFPSNSTATLLIGVGALPPSFAIAALLGALFLEHTAPIRMKMANVDSESPPQP